jgi:hypothetical protein
VGGWQSCCGSGPLAARSGCRPAPAGPQRERLACTFATSAIGGVSEHAVSAKCSGSPPAATRHARVIRRFSATCGRAAEREDQRAIGLLLDWNGYCKAAETSAA